MQKERVIYLFEQYRLKKATLEEAQELLRFMEEYDSKEVFADSVSSLTEEYPSSSEGLASTVHLADTVLQMDKLGSAAEPYISGQRKPSVPRVHFLRKWYWAAASIILLLGIGSYLWTTNKKNIQPPVVTVPPADIAPGKNGAILTLADGSQVVLDSLGNGLIASQNGAQVVLKNGGLAYDPTGQAAGEVTYNTMTTPKGRQFQVVLPDGTKVWLNAASSLRYPTVFNGNERNVEIKGEAYFEVAQNRRMPFRVKVNDKAAVEVLGTHFNVNAYEDEGSINTTLLEGAVRVELNQHPQPGKMNSGPVILKPGQQAQVTDSIDVVNNTDIDKVMAWKNGLFNFEGASLKEVMRQLERWYDIEVVYENKGVEKEEFVGKMTRGITLNQLLVTLEELGIHCRLEGRKLIVL